MASGPEGTEPLNCKTWVLKVSIHCGGCERKIKRILHKIKGVYDIEIDANQNRVTVTGNIDGESLVQKLLKYGKHAELLTEKSPTPATSAAKIESNGKEKAVPAATAPETEEKKQSEKGKAVIQSPEIPPAATTVSDEITAPKPDTDSKSQPEKISSVKAVPASDTENKKKEKEVKGEESRVNEREISGTVSTAGVNSPQFPANISPLYATASYHTAHPSTSHAYYAAAPPEMASNYAYYDNSPAASSPPPVGYSPPYYYSTESYYGSMEQPSTSTESYDMFNDENPNACELM
ncbi:heavy metal-associated isoprenylated plant protein 35-like [Phalaenopsis equestris]|uniref:heavy metal-associated isoprenylated plant protein 35-like n=1 Tax=Phalaenopsis equestris TaxID=78828 RepID=UPI0009E65CB0|nr:heavy metal-associated isoprenylated plant protein 35-like [Phalaenopsis equestris]